MTIMIRSGVKNPEREEPEEELEEADDVAAAGDEFVLTVVPLPVEDILLVILFILYVMHQSYFAPVLLEIRWMKLELHQNIAPS